MALNVFQPKNFNVMKKVSVLNVIFILCILWIPSMSTTSMLPSANRAISASINPTMQEDELDGPKWFDYKKHVNSKGFLCCKPKDNRKCGWGVVCPGYDPPGPPVVE